MRLALDMGPVPELRQERRAKRVKPRPQPDGWEFVNGQAWQELRAANNLPPLPAVYVALTPDRTEALSHAYLLGITTGDIYCGLMDVVPVFKPKTRKPRAKRRR